MDPPAPRRVVEGQVARWVYWCNITRLHSSIVHLPPVEFGRAIPAGSGRGTTPEVAYHQTLGEIQDGLARLPHDFNRDAGQHRRLKR